MKNFILLIILSALAFSTSAQAKEISLKEVLEKTETNTPYLSVAKLQEIAATKSIDIAAASYYPQVSLESVYSGGFPGSTGAAGIEGLMGSPYRSGLAGGATVRQVILDFGRTESAIEASTQEVEVSKQDTKLTLYKVRMLASQKFYECSLFRTQKELWQYLNDESSKITKEVIHFVETGQYSVVDRYLSQAQTQETQSAKAFYAERLKQTIQELSVIMGTTENFSCPLLSTIQNTLADMKVSTDASPFLQRAQANATLAAKQLKHEESKIYPEIVAVASAGAMQKARLVTEKNYAAGIGIKLPIIDFNTLTKISQAQAITMIRDKEIEAEKQHLDETNANYDELIKSSNTLLNQLGIELKVADQAFSLAKKRYYSLQGNLLDLREAFRNMTRVRSNIEDTRAKILISRSAKALLNGAEITN